MPNLLFICSQNKLRSPTAEAVFKSHQHWQVKSAGLDSDATVCVNPAHIQWADYIFVMEQSHKHQVQKRFKGNLANKVLISLGIPDEYDYMDKTLIQILKNKVPDFIEH